MNQLACSIVTAVALVSVGCRSQDSNGEGAQVASADAAYGGKGGASGGSNAPGTAGDTSLGGGGLGAGTAGGSSKGGSSSNEDSGSDASQSGPCPFGSSEFFLWPGMAPGTTGGTLVEKFTDRSADAAAPDRSVTGVSKPSLFSYLAPRPNGAAAVVLPGGGYTHLAFDKEGVEIAAWLNSLGISAFVLKYRMPVDFPGSPWIPLADAQRAVRTIRKNAAKCAIDPSRIGVIGFSAGGHLASQIETRFGAQTSPPQDDIDALDARPSFGVLMYPVISMDPAIAHAGSRTALLGSNPTQANVNLYSSELQVSATTPATFLGVSTKDTTVDPQNSVRFDDALKTAGIAHELHLYKDGTHGVGIRDATGDIAAWPQQCASWLKGRNVIDAAQ